MPQLRTETIHLCARSLVCVRGLCIYAVASSIRLSLYAVLLITILSNSCMAFDLMGDPVYGSMLAYLYVWLFKGKLVLKWVSEMICYNYYTLRLQQRQRHSVPPPTPPRPVKGTSTLPSTKHQPTSNLSSTSQSLTNTSPSRPTSSPQPQPTLIIPSQLSLYSSQQQLQISSVRITCQESSSENHTQRFLESAILDQVVQSILCV